jgi:predicted alpha/beta hydrolase family esterase
VRNSHYCAHGLRHEQPDTESHVRSPVGIRKLAWLPLILLTACAAPQYFRTQIADEPCEIASQTCRDANLLSDNQHQFGIGFVEFDDQGRFINPQQAQALTQWLSAETQQPLYVVIYTHGWHHNASHNDANVQRFEERLRELKRDHNDYKVIGIYLGWRGETITTPWLRTLSFWGRRTVSESLGKGQYRDLLLEIEKIVKRDSENKLVTIGHSLGAMVLFNALKYDWQHRVRHGAPGFGDLLLLINPAIEAEYFSAFVEDVQQPEDTPTATSLLVISSENDYFTQTPFTWSRILPTLWQSLPDAYSGNHAASWDLKTTAIGHYRPFLTHRLESTPTASGTPDCPSVLYPEQTEQSSDIGDTNNNSLKLKELHPDQQQKPIWFIQTDKNILPNHNFINQKLIWCFIDDRVFRD